MTREKKIISLIFFYLFIYHNIKRILGKIFFSYLININNHHHFFLYQHQRGNPQVIHRHAFSSKVCKYKFFINRDLFFLYSLFCIFPFFPQNSVYANLFPFLFLFFIFTFFFSFSFSLYNSRIKNATGPFTYRASCKYS